MPFAPQVTLISKSRVYPGEKSAMGDLKLSVTDLPMLSCHYIQKGCLFTRPSLPVNSILSLLKRSLSLSLSHFPPLAGRFLTLADGTVVITCNDSGVDFIYADASSLNVVDVLGPSHVPDIVKGFFTFDGAVSYEGHNRPLLAVQVTFLADGVFIACSVNHAIADGTSFWNFFNTFAELSRGFKKVISHRPDFSRDSVFVSPAVLHVPEGGPKVTFDQNAPFSERIFSFSREAILELKARVNKRDWAVVVDGDIDVVELMGKKINDKFYCHQNGNAKLTEIFDTWFANTDAEKESRNVSKEKTTEISSFQSLCALLWRAVTRARNLPELKTTTFRMAMNCRHRLNPKLDPLYFGNAIQSVPTYAPAGELLSRDLRWCAKKLNQNVLAQSDETIRKLVAEWEANPRLFPLGNFDGASVTMGSSPRFPMYDNDFGWGRPLAIRSGKANKFDGKISAFPGREGNGSVDLEVILAPETMAGVESDPEFMHYVSN